MAYHLIPVCTPVEKKRKLSYEVNDDNTTAAVEMTGGGSGRQFLTIPRSDNIFQTENWRSADSALFLPVKEDLLVNVCRAEQISCTEGQYFVADDSGKYSQTLKGKVIHFWRYDKTERKLYISRSFLFTAMQEYLSVHQFLQHI